MLMIRETSMSILLVWLLLIELSHRHVAGLGQPEDNCMEMRLRRVLEKLVSLASPEGQEMTRKAKDLEVDELLGLTKRTLFGSPQWETRRKNFMEGPNPGNFFGSDKGAFPGGNIRAGVMIGPKGVWAQVGGGIGPVIGSNETWFEQPGHGMGAHTQSQNNVVWTMTWPPNQSNGPIWVTGSPKFQDSTPFSWFTTRSSAWPNWGTVNFGTTPNPPQWSTNKPFWLQNSTINSSWFFSPTTGPAWFIAPKAASNVPSTASPKTANDWDTLTKKISPSTETNATTLKPLTNSTLATKL